MNNKAFTLIELLVVVLIIGILAAVAVPQYKLAVIKARVHTYLPVLNDIAQAQETYYMANGTYTIDPDLLGLDMPTTCHIVGRDTRYWSCESFFMIWLNYNVEAILSYCPDNNTTYTACTNKRDFGVNFQYTHSSGNGNRFCNSKTPLGEKICKSLKLD